jgi:hypothetical protein
MILYHSLNRQDQHIYSPSCHCPKPDNKHPGQHVDPDSTDSNPAKHHYIPQNCYLDLGTAYIHSHNQ